LVLRVTLALISVLPPPPRSALFPYTTLFRSTFWPSCSVLLPVPLMALKWTNTSFPPSCSMKPKPFSSLNHLTVPSTCCDILLSCYFQGINQKQSLAVPNLFSQLTNVTTAGINTDS